MAHVSRAENSVQPPEEASEVNNFAAVYWVGAGASGGFNSIRHSKLQGHTDGGNFTGPQGGSNWELSAGRANSALKVLDNSGVTSDRFFEVTGKAGTDPLYPDQPTRSENRRITILILREAPVVPPNLTGGN